VGVIGTDHFLVAKMCWRRNRYERKEEQKVKVIRVSELLKEENAEMYKELKEGYCILVRIQAVGSVDKEWGSFKSTILRILEEVCRLRTVGSRGRTS
jgi:hypothetical protein